MLNLVREFRESFCEEVTPETGSHPEMRGGKGVSAEGTQAKALGLERGHGQYSAQE